MELMEQGRFSSVSIDADQSEKLVKLLDTVVIKLEGGTDLDLQVLESIGKELKVINENKFVYLDVE